MGGGFVPAKPQGEGVGEVPGPPMEGSKVGSPCGWGRFPRGIETGPLGVCVGHQESDSLESK